MDTCKKEVKHTKKKRSKKQIITVIIASVFLLIMLGFVAYPYISNTYSDRMQAEVRVEYEEEIKKQDENVISDALAAARLYNEHLAGITENDFEEAYLLEAAADYHNLLNVNSHGIIGYLDIPIISLYNQPIYHGDDKLALENGVEHLFGTSLPVGGKNTHAVLSAHTGQTNKKGFTDISQMTIGDIFYISVFGEKLAYEVDEINVVDPADTSKIQIIPNEDYVTLVTCYPYSVNSHRYLVRGTRTELQEAEEQERITLASRQVDSEWSKQLINGILAGLLIVAVLLAIYFSVKLIKKRAKKCKKQKAGPAEKQ